MVLYIYYVSSLKRSGKALACVDKGWHIFTGHPHVYPVSTSRMKHPANVSWNNCFRSIFHVAGSSRSNHCTFSPEHCVYVFCVRLASADSRKTDAYESQYELVHSVPGRIMDLWIQLLYL